MAFFLILEYRMTDTQVPEKVLTPEEFYELFKDDPELTKVPLPNSWYKKLKIPAPRAVSFQDFALQKRWLEHKYDSDLIYEVRKEPAPGGVRPVLESEPIPVEIITKPTDETSDETSQLLEKESAPPKESTETKPPLSTADPTSQYSCAV